MDIDLNNNDAFTSAGTDISAMVFRIKGNWLAMPTTLFHKIVDINQPHTIPGKTDNRLRGIVNAGGDLLLCFSLPDILGIGDINPLDAGEKSRPRLVVIGEAENRFAFAVDEISGIHAISTADLIPHATIVDERGEPVQVVLIGGVETLWLDGKILFDAVNRSLADGTR